MKPENYDALSREKLVRRRREKETRGKAGAGRGTDN
jgi:stalled ribosome alternative rescue factor ArfA